LRLLFWNPSPVPDHSVPAAIRAFLHTVAKAIPALRHARAVTSKADHVSDGTASTSVTAAALRLSPAHTLGAPVLPAAHATAAPVTARSLTGLTTPAGAWNPVLIGVRIEDRTAHRRKCQDHKRESKTRETNPPAYRASHFHILQKQGAHGEPQITPMNTDSGLRTIRKP
jgi:hypothetical protein